MRVYYSYTTRIATADELLSTAEQNNQSQPPRPHLGDNELRKADEYAYFCPDCRWIPLWYNRPVFESPFRTRNASWLPRSPSAMRLPRAKRCTNSPWSC